LNFIKNLEKISKKKSLLLTLPLVSSIMAHSLRVRAMASARLASEPRWKSREPHCVGESFEKRGKERKREVSERSFSQFG